MAENYEHMDSLVLCKSNISPKNLDLIQQNYVDFTGVIIYPGECFRNNQNMVLAIDDAMVWNFLH